MRVIEPRVPARLSIWHPLSERRSRQVEELIAAPELAAATPADQTRLDYAMHARTRPSLCEQLQALPEGLTGKSLDGQLHTQPRPAPRHLGAASRLDRIIGRRLDDGDGGPGG